VRLKRRLFRKGVPRRGAPKKPPTSGRLKYSSCKGWSEGNANPPGKGTFKKDILKGYGVLGWSPKKKGFLKMGNGVEKVR